MIDFKKYDKTRIIRRAFAFFFIILGLISSLLNKIIFDNLCIICFKSSENQITLIFLFVEIIFIICGVSWLITENSPPETSLNA